MIINPQYLILLPLVFSNFKVVDNKKPDIEYQPYTTSSMIDTNDIRFYENFWNSIIKEDCDSNSMVE